MTTCGRSAMARAATIWLLPKFQKFAKSRQGKSYYVRGTFTHNNLDFSEDVLHLADAWI